MASAEGDFHPHHHHLIHTPAYHHPPDTSPATTTAGPAPAMPAIAQKRREKALYLFHRLDRDNNGRISLAELKSTMEQLGLRATEEQVKSMVSLLARDSAEGIALGDFLAFAQSIPDYEWSDMDLESLLADIWLLEADAFMQTAKHPLRKSEKEAEPWKFLTAGGVAGAVSRTATSPLELAKIIYQVQPDRYHNLRDVFRKHLKEGGIRALWKGNGANVLRIAPFTAIQFYSYETFCKLLVADSQELSVTRRLTAGALAGCCAALATYPLDLARTRLSLMTAGQNRSLANVLRQVYAEGGVPGLYRGWFPTVAGIAPYVAINFVLYDFLKRKMLAWYQASESINKPSLPLSLSLTCGALAGAGALTATYPLDVIRRRCHVSMEGYTNLFRYTLGVARKEGVGALFNGLSPCYLKVMPAMAINFVVYENVKSYLKAV